MNKLSPVIQSIGPVQQSSPQSSPVIRYGRLSFHPIPCGSRDRPAGRKVIDELGKCVGHCACERQEQRILLDR